MLYSTTGELRALRLFCEPPGLHDTSGLLHFEQKLLSLGQLTTLALQMGQCLRVAGRSIFWP